MDTNTATAEIDIVSEGLALVSSSLGKKILHHIEEKHPEKKWQDVFYQNLAPGAQKVYGKNDRLQKEWMSKSTFTIEYMYKCLGWVIIPVQDKKPHKSSGIRRIRKKTKKIAVPWSNLKNEKMWLAVCNLAKARSKNIEFDSFSYHSSTDMFNDMITIAEFLEDSMLVDRLNKLYDELCRIEDRQY